MIRKLFVSGRDPVFLQNHLPERVRVQNKSFSLRPDGKTYIFGYQMGSSVVSVLEQVRVLEQK